MRRAPDSLPPTVKAPTGSRTPPSAQRVGVTCGIAAYGFWGLVPIYFKAVRHVPALEVLAHRIVWSVVFLLVLTLIERNWGAVRSCLRSPRALLTLSVTTLLIAVNWVGFIWAVANDQVMQASLGYFINPLVNVLLGFVFLRERLRRWQGLSVALATIGVLYLTFAAGQFPALGLLLAGTFGFYGLLRKVVKIEALVGLTIETCLLLVPALAFLTWQIVQGSAAFGSGSLRTDLLCMAAGLVTAVPLLWFAAAARRLRLATMGFLQYLAPTGHFLLAVWAYGEPFARANAIAFGLIWTALVIYTLDAAWGVRADRNKVAVPVVE